MIKRVVRCRKNGSPQRGAETSCKPRALTCSALNSTPIKTNKTTVLAELDKALEVGKIKSPEEYSAEAARLKAQKAQLNDTITALHEKRNCGVTLYEAISAYERSISEKDKNQFQKTSSLTWQKKLPTASATFVHRYSIAIAETGDFLPTSHLKISALHHILWNSVTSSH